MAHKRLDKVHGKFDVFAASLCPADISLESH
jgi:hypothetical protein